MITSHSSVVYKEVTDDLDVRVYDDHTVEVRETIDGQPSLIDPELWNDSLIDYAVSVYENAKVLGYLK